MKYHKEQCQKVERKLFQSIGSHCSTKKIMKCTAKGEESQSDQWSYVDKTGLKEVTFSKNINQLDKSRQK